MGTWQPQLSTMEDDRTDAVPLGKSFAKNPKPKNQNHPSSVFHEDYL